MLFNANNRRETTYTITEHCNQSTYIWQHKAEASLLIPNTVT